jgi:hypothetical protein
MSENLIRASLDQALLAVAAPDTPEGAVRATLAQALATLANADQQPRQGPRAGSGRASNVFDKWRRELREFDLDRGLPDFKVEPKASKDILVDPQGPGNPRRKAPIQE